MCRSESVTARLSSFAVSSAVMPSSMVLPLDFDIFVPSRPSTMPDLLNSASGAGKTGRDSSTRPYRSSKRRAITRACSRCGSWSLPTGTRLALQNRMSAAWCTG